MQVKKITFEEAWNTTTAFLIDEEIENAIDNKVESIAKASINGRISHKPIKVEKVADYLKDKKEGLEVILSDLTLSQEKFIRIVSLLRRICRIGSGFNSEWNFQRIKTKIKEDEHFSREVAKLLVEGAEDRELKKLLPRYYLEKLNLKEVVGEPEVKRRLKIKEQESRKWYGNLKGKKVENIIRDELERIKLSYGITYERGRIDLIHTDADWIVPSKNDAYIIIMVSYQETTSSGQTNKARDMYRAYERVRERNMRYKENRVFINFVDGIGWLARKADFKRLVEECHYFLNLNHLGMLEFIVKKHVPSKFFNKKKIRDLLQH
ncbi:MAG: hypothetical protein FJ242_00595 [Nitrospira sp.]|nr:hypothetical protein [Nitrospira sp.]